MIKSKPKIGLPFWHFVNEYEENVDKYADVQYVLSDLAKACAEIHHYVNRAGLENIHGKTGDENVQGEEVMKLDILSNDILINHLMESKYCGGVASEEMEEEIIFENKVNSIANYIVVFDPLDGSSNIDVNAPIGTIFGIYRKEGSEVTKKDFLQRGSDIVGSGYVLYGSSTVLIYSVGNGVHEFTFDANSQDFRLSRYDIKTPNFYPQFSINYGNSKDFSSPLSKYFSWAMKENEASNRPYSLRYIGSMVADFHRILIKGGVFLYPATEKAKSGKLRLVYECNPLGYIIEQAGGKTSNEVKSILEIKPSKLHQRTPIILGSEKNVNEVMKYFNE